MSKAGSHCVRHHLHAHQETVNALAQFGRKLVLGMRRKWPRPRRDRDVDNFSRDETETRRWYVSRLPWDRDVETKTTTLRIGTLHYNWPMSMHASQAFSTSSVPLPLV